MIWKEERQSRIVLNEQLPRQTAKQTAVRKMKHGGVCDNGVIEFEKRSAICELCGKRRAESEVVGNLQWAVDEEKRTSISGKQ